MCTWSSARSRCARTARSVPLGGSEAKPEALEALAASLLGTDRVALEVTGSSWEIVRILEPHVAKVVVVSPSDTGILHARAKTDRLDARTLARLLWVGDLDEVWTPDQRTRVLRRRFASRAAGALAVAVQERDPRGADAPVEGPLPSLGHVRQGRPPVAAWWSWSCRSRSARRSRRRCVRSSSSMRRSPRWTGSSPNDPAVWRCPASDERARGERRCAATFLGAIGDILRFRTSRQLVAYLGLDPKVRQSGSEPARIGHISKQGSPQTRWALVEATHSVVLQPGPLRAFHQRIRARRGYNVATVAAARKLACLFWCLLPATRTTRTRSRH